MKKVSFEISHSSFLTLLPTPPYLLTRHPQKLKTTLLHMLPPLFQLLFPWEKEVMSQDQKGGVYWLDGLVELVEHRRTRIWKVSSYEFEAEGQSNLCSTKRSSSSWDL